MLSISNHIQIPDAEIEISAIRAGGPGGQNVNKVSSAIHLRFDVGASSLPEAIKSKVLGLHDYRVSGSGVIVIKAQRFRTREKNLEDALNRLKTLILSAIQEQKPRKQTRPTQGSKKRRLEGKTRRGETKKLRQKVVPHD